VFVGKTDNVIYKWNVTQPYTTMAPSLFTGHTLQVWAVNSLQDGRVASGSADGNIKFWNVTTGACLYTLAAAHGLANSVNDLELLSNGALASAGGDGTIKTWNTTKYTLLSTMSPTYEVNVLKTLSNANLAAGDFWGAITVWNVTSLALVFQLANAHSDKINEIEALSNGSFVSASSDYYVCEWDVNGNLRNSFNPFGNTVRAVRSLPSGYLAVAGTLNQVHIWNIKVRNAATWVKSITVSSSYVSTKIYALLVYQSSLLVVGTDLGYAMLYNFSSSGSSLNNVAALYNGNSQNVFCLEQACNFLNFSCFKEIGYFAFFLV
jgi:WD40 repeat protein